ncbi:Uncharacterised protein [BD1-7 clade bacterium]|uniref:Uncharacterized protein n=1 Tax=BD1-7 clade bacterium TaxID=2029982 RepID=A0A5S9QKE9_9GAMM|nr:Uncharacterised protein [BD1-7 clade bacterium]
MPNAIHAEFAVRSISPETAASLSSTTCTVIVLVPLVSMVLLEGKIFKPNGLDWLLLPLDVSIWASADTGCWLNVPENRRLSFRSQLLVVYVRSSSEESAVRFPESVDLPKVKQSELAFKLIDPDTGWPVEFLICALMLADSPGKRSLLSTTIERVTGLIVILTDSDIDSPLKVPEIDTISVPKQPFGV